MPLHKYVCGQTFLLEFIYRACASRNEPAVKAGLSKATKTKLQHITLNTQKKCTFVGAMKTITKAISIVILLYSCFLCAKPEVKMGDIPINVACRSIRNENIHFEQAYSTIEN